MKILQVRNVPDHVHRTLKARAALAGTSLFELVLAELRKSAERPTRAELLARIAARPKADVEPSPGEALRAERERR